MCLRVCKCFLLAASSAVNGEPTTWGFCLKRQDVFLLSFFSGNFTIFGANENRKYSRRSLRYSQTLFGSCRPAKLISEDSLFCMKTRSTRYTPSLGVSSLPEMLSNNMKIKFLLKFPRIEVRLPWVLCAVATNWSRTHDIFTYLLTLKLSGKFVRYIIGQTFFTRRWGYGSKCLTFMESTEGLYSSTKCPDIGQNGADVE